MTSDSSTQNISAVSLLSKYGNLLLIGDFNSTMSEEAMKGFCETYNLNNLIKSPTCYKSLNNPTSIDVMLTNRKHCFENSVTIETGLSDHHKMTISVLKVFHNKRPPIVKRYRCYRNFDMNTFRNKLRYNLDIYNGNTIMGYDEFIEIFMTLLNKDAPMKKKVIRGNNAPFMSKPLSKEIMHRSKLKNKFNKIPTEENRNLYKKQRNICVNLLRKEKKSYFNRI